MKRMRRASEHPTSADVNLNEDLILDILSRLPTATLARFKRVCKDWRRRLIPRILGHRPNLAFIVQLEDLMPRFLCYSHDGGVRQDLCFHSLLDSCQRNLADSCFPDELLNLCNGMALARIQTYPRRCSMFQFYDDPHLKLGETPDPNREYIVINPVTGRGRIIPSPPAALSTPSSSLGLGLGLTDHILAFDPRRSSRHFKVVAFTNCLLQLEPEAPFLYSSRTKRWRRLEEPAHLSCFKTHWAVNESSYCLNGRAYRIAELCFTRLMGVLTLHACIAVFHVEGESLTSITSPGAAASAAAGEDHRSKCSLGESGGGRLFYAYRGARFLWVWVLEDCSCSGGRWSLRHRVDVVDAYPRCWPTVSCLAFHPEDANVVFLTISECLYIFDLKRANLHEVRKLGQEHSGCLVHPFLCSPKSKLSSSSSLSSSRPSYHHSLCDCESLEEEY